MDDGAEVGASRKDDRLRVEVLACIDPDSLNGAVFDKQVGDLGLMQVEILRLKQNSAVMVAVDPGTSSELIKQVTVKIRNPTKTGRRI